MFKTIRNYLKKIKFRSCCGCYVGCDDSIKK